MRSFLKGMIIGVFLAVIICFSLLMVLKFGLFRGNGFIGKSLGEYTEIQSNQDEIVIVGNSDDIELETGLNIEEIQPDEVIQDYITGIYDDRCTNYVFDSLLQTGIMIFSWEVDAGETKNFSLFGNNDVPVIINWGDGIIEQLTGRDISHKYVRQGIYTVQINDIENISQMELWRMKIFCFKIGNATNLKRLNISNNKIQLVGEGTFYNVPSLETLLLGENPLKDISGVKILSNLKTLNFLDAGLHELPDNIFDDFHNLKVLRLTNCEGIELKSDTFKLLENLEELYLDGIQISELPEGIFDNLKSLKILDLSDNNISTLNSNTFSRLSNLSVLRLYNNKLKDLPEGIFDNLKLYSWNAMAGYNSNSPSDPGLSILNNCLDSDNIPKGTLSIIQRASDPSREKKQNNCFSVLNGKEVPESESVAIFLWDVTTGDRNLEKKITVEYVNTGSFYLDRGDGTEVEYFSNEKAGSYTAKHVYSNTGNYKVQLLDISNIKSLGLGGGRITQIMSVKNAKNLVKLELGNNRIEKISYGTFDNLPSLEYLSFHYNNINVIESGSFAGLNKLKRLSLSQIPITSLPENLFENLSSLEELFIVSTKQINNLPENIFLNLVNLKQLTLQGSVETLPNGIFSNLQSLEYLNLINNDIKTLPDGIFSNLIQLFDLNLCYNNIQTLPDGVFSNQKKMVHLHICHNEIKDIPVGLFSNLKSLYSLDISNNQVDEIGKNVFNGLNKLYLLNLGNNNISEIPNGAFKNLNSLSLIDLSNNNLKKFPDLPKGFSPDKNSPSSYFYYTESGASTGAGNSVITVGINIKGNFVKIKDIPEKYITNEMPFWGV